MSEENQPSVSNECLVEVSLLKTVELLRHTYVRSAARCRQPCTFQTLVVTLVLPKRCTAWPTGLPSASSTVGNECGGMADLPHEICGPYHRRCCFPERIEYKVAVLTYKVLHGSAPRSLWTTCSCCRSPRPTDITLWWHQSSAGATYHAFDSR